MLAKQDSLTFAEYREYSQAINKLCDTISLFLDVNKVLFESENRKKKLKKGSWRST